MRKNWLFLSLATMLLTQACKKEEENAPDAQTFSQSQEVSDVRSENDAVNDDVDKALDAFPILKGGRIAADTTLNDVCGCKIDKSQLASKKITLKFDGVTPCLTPTRVRSGEIVIELIGNRWSDAGAILKATFNNFKVVRESNGNSFLFNGVKTRKNLNGVNWLKYIVGNDSLVFQERAKDLQINVNNTGNRSYSLARKSVVWLKQKQNGLKTFLKVSGDTTINQVSGIDAWGKNVAGIDFLNYFEKPWISDAYCGFWRPTSGKYTHKFNNNIVSITLGVNTSGAIDTRDCAYGWKVNWTNSNGNTGEKIVSY